MRRWLQRLLARLFQALIVKPDPELVAKNHAISEAYLELVAKERQRRDALSELVSEMAEAVQMSGSGPWKIGPKVAEQTNTLIRAAQRSMEAGSNVPLREAFPQLSQGAFGDIELALQNVDWMRQVNLSWLEFSRWGIQQIILISRLYYIKNPIVRRLIDISAAYVFGRGVEVSSTDEDANDVLKEFFEANTKVLGQIGLVKLEKQKYYDGNLFFAFFADLVDKGTVTVRTIDATEMQEVITDPDDTDTPWYYKRVWTQKTFDQEHGVYQMKTQEAWYPALNYEPKAKPETFNQLPIMWDTPVLHRKCGEVAKWTFGCPIIYPAIDWARAARRFLEACATVRLSLATIAATLTTKGGQQAMEGAKQQLSTTVGPSASIWDSNPTPVNASYFVSGPGTTLAAFNTKGAGGDPEDVRQYKLMCCMVTGVPETFLADVSTGNLATATTLDRPTELVFLERQESWREDLVTIAKYVLGVSDGAPSGKLREARQKRNLKAGSLRITEARRYKDASNRWVYEDAKPKPDALEVKCTFPAIREGDIPALITAVATAMTLGNTAGQVVGIDERAGVEKLFELIGFENAAEKTEEMYPKDEYDPDRTKEPLPAPIPPAVANQGGEPQDPPKPDATAPVPVAAHLRQPPTPPVRPTTKEAFRKLRNALETFEVIGR